MKALLVTTTIIALAATSTLVNAQTTDATAPSAASSATAAAPYYSTEESPLGELLDNPETRAVLEKHIPKVINNDQIDQARGMTLKAIQPYASEMLTDQVLADIDADLKAIPEAK